MVHASTFLLVAAAALAASPALAIPLQGEKASHEHKHHQAKHEHEPKHKQHKLGPKDTAVAPSAPVATPLPAAPVPTTVELPAASTPELKTRFIEDFDGSSLEARTPWSFKKALRGAARAAVKWGPKVAPLLVLRDEDGVHTLVDARDLSLDELAGFGVDARELDFDLDDLDARELFLDDLDARDLSLDDLASLDLDARELSLDDLESLDARSPLPSPDPWGWSDIKAGARKGLNTATHVVRTAHRVAGALGVREDLEDGVEFEARSEGLDAGSDALNLETRSETLDAASETMDLEARAAGSAAGARKRKFGSPAKPQRNNLAAKRRQRQSKNRANRQRGQKQQQQRRRRQQRRLGRKGGRKGPGASGGKKRVGKREFDEVEEVVEARSVSIDALD